MLFTIIIPSYNSAHVMEGALQSISMQTFQDWQLLIMDNHSTDNTIQVIRSVFGNDERVSFCTMKDNGIYDAMNKGIELAVGDWLLFMGADDRLHDLKVLEQVATQVDQADLVYGDVLWKPSDELESGEWTLEKLLDININHQRIFYRKHLFSKFANYDIRYRIASDYQLNIRFFCNNSIRKKYVPVIVSDYNSTGFSSNRTDELFWKEWKQNVLMPFTPYLPKSKIYKSKGFYVRYLISRKKYWTAIGVTFDIFIHTFSFGFLLLMMRQTLQKS